ncbi:MAG TPA: hypothetical protein VMQ73_01495, partial [Methylomirabilota bacterium]|nr:hypothetical protein [Methylomirabilota bacterium]
LLDKFPNYALLEKIPAPLIQSRPVDFTRGSRNDAIIDLITAATGRVPAIEVPTPQSIPAAKEEVSRANLALALILDSLDTESLTLFVGSQFKRGCYTGADHYEAAKHLLTDMGIVDDAYSHLLPPLEFVAAHYTVRRATGALQERLARDGRGVSETPEIFEDLVLLIQGLIRHGKKRRFAVTQRPQLVVETSRDILLVSVRKVVESTESAVIHCRAPESVDGGARCGQSRTVRSMSARDCAIRAM